MPAAPRCKAENPYVNPMEILCVPAYFLEKNTFIVLFLERMERTEHFIFLSILSNLTFLRKFIEELQVDSQRCTVAMT
jgi:hypothetical protein